MNLELIKIDNNDKELIQLWDKFVDESKEGTFYHKSYWLLNNKGKGIKVAQDCELYYLIDKNKKWKAAFYIPYTVKLNKKFISMPHMTPYAGVMFSNDIHKLAPYKRMSNIKDINDVFIKSLKEKTVLYYSFSPEHKDIQPFIWNKYVPSIRYTYRLNITDEKTMWGNFGEKTSVNKGRKSNVEIKWGKKELLSTFQNLNAQSFERQNVNNFDEKLTENLLINALENESCIIGILYDDNNEAVAGCILAYDTKRAYYIMGGIAKTNNFAMSYLLWEAIILTKDSLGLDQFDFEGSMIPSIEKYFRKLGGEITPYYSLNNIALVAKNVLR